MGIVIVNYHGGERTVACARAVERSTWPADRRRTVVVDNGDDAGFAGDLRRAVPGVTVLAPERNLGFSGGCNVGLDGTEDCDYVALLNNDATPDPDWLDELIGALRGSGAGAATPKVVLDRTFVEVRVRVPRPASAGGDPRDLGVQLSGVRVDGRDVTGECYLRDGFWGWEEDADTVGGRFTWSAGAATLLVPVQRRPERLEVRHSNGVGRTAATFATDAGEVTVTAAPAPEWVELPAAVDPSPVVNNAGMVLLRDGRTADRGFLELDRGQYDQPGEVFGFSAAAVVLSRSFLDEVGRFDDRFFLYYEDADLSWRGRTRGWRYCYVPSVRVAHEHSATVGKASPLAEHLAARNRLLMLTKNAPLRVVGQAVGGLLGDLVGALRRDLLGPAIRFRRPVRCHVVRHGRVAAGYVRLLPATLVDRVRIRRARSVPDACILAWTQAAAIEELRLDGR